MSGGKDGTVRLWGRGTGVEIGSPLRGHEGAVSIVAVARDGHKIVSRGWNGRVRLWDVTDVYSADIVSIACDQLQADDTTELETDTGLKIGQVCTAEQRRVKLP